jgi:hypothetical protein
VTRAVVRRFPSAFAPACSFFYDNKKVLTIALRLTDD